MVRTSKRSVFEGIESEDTVRASGWLQKKVNGEVQEENPSLTTWANEIATEHEIVSGAFGQPDEDIAEFDRSSKFQVVVDKNDPEKFHSPVSPRFNLIDNQEVVDVVEDVMEDFNLNDSVYGVARDYSKLTVLDLYFDHENTEFDYDKNAVTEKMRFGVEIRSAHDASGSLKVRPIVRKEYGKSTIRHHNWKTMRHVNAEFAEEDQDKRHRMYKLIAESVFELGYQAEDLVEKVEVADMVEMDFRDVDFTVADFYETWLPDNTPDSLINSASSRAVKRSDEMSSRSDEPTEFMSAWTLVSGATYAVAHGSNMSDGNQKDRFYKKITKALGRPQLFVDSVSSKTEERLEEEQNNEATPFEKASVIQTELGELE